MQKVVTLDTQPSRAAALGGGDEGRTARGQETRDRILDGALAILAEGGAGALSISAVCARAKIAPTSLYHHFGSKAGLMAGMVEQAIRRDRARHLARIEGEATHTDQLAAYMASLRESLISKEMSTSSVLAALGQGRGASDEFAEVLIAARHAQWLAIAREFEAIAGVADGTPFAHAVVAFTNLASQAFQESGDPAEVDALLASLRRIIALIGIAGFEDAQDTPLGVPMVKLTAKATAGHLRKGNCP